jgi:hypothetical protein
VWFGLGGGADDQELVGVGQDHLLLVAGAARQPGERANPWLDHFDDAGRRVGLDIGDGQVDPVPDGGWVGVAPLALEQATQGAADDAV